MERRMVFIVQLGRPLQNVLQIEKKLISYQISFSLLV